ncbi:glucuronyl hydrolase [Bacillus sp. SA1-12]|uniref:glycoside hydrolase family 88 protein n=1 Tax=Bacillus sp. SA1-12 TaxID=1455638 RepID=UPI00062516E9|nr:glycoside hydrolase family 88 protein [Bacillus sp. SA1-12]KKI92182.1 glucuronyl hydrolase [Bacillus sp. SA1-12]
MSNVIKKERIINHDRFFNIEEITKKDWVEKALEHVLKKIDQNLTRFGEDFPSASTKDSKYLKVSGDDVDWTEGFWTGMLWLAFEITNDQKYKRIADIQVKRFKERIKKQIKTNTHDLGFLYSLSCVSAYKLTGNQEAKEAALLAADLLIMRYHEKAGILQAWGDLNNPEESGRMIIDCNLNLPLLYWATEETGDKRYATLARNHIQNAKKYLVRNDASTFHTYFMDVVTGEPIAGKTHQGYSDDSCWSRGQAWGIYGFTLNYIYTKDTSLLELSKTLANYFLNRLPKDHVCYWDLIFTEGSGQERDSSAASISVCGLLEMIKHLPLLDEEKVLYEHAALIILKSLSENYTTIESDQQHGLLRHGVYNKPRAIGIDESNLWGDYYYFEALVRLSKSWNLYW